MHASELSYSMLPSSPLSMFLSSGFIAASQNCFVMKNKITISYPMWNEYARQPADIIQSWFDNRLIVSLEIKPGWFLKTWAFRQDDVWYQSVVWPEYKYRHTVELFEADNFPLRLDIYLGWWAPQAANVTQARHNVCDACVTACVEQSEPICHAICDSVSRHVGELKCSAMDSLLVQVAKQADNP